MIVNWGYGMGSEAGCAPVVDNCGQAWGWNGMGWVPLGQTVQPPPLQPPVSIGPLPGPTPGGVRQVPTGPPRGGVRQIPVPGPTISVPFPVPFAVPVPQGPFAIPPPALRCPDPNQCFQDTPALREFCAPFGGIEPTTPAPPVGAGCWTCRFCASGPPPPTPPPPGPVPGCPPGSRLVCPEPIPGQPLRPCRCVTRRQGDPTELPPPGLAPTLPFQYSAPFLAPPAPVFAQEEPFVVDCLVWDAGTGIYRTVRTNRQACLNMGGTLFATDKEGFKDRCRAVGGTVKSTVYSWGTHVQCSPPGVRPFGASFDREGKTTGT